MRFLWKNSRPIPDVNRDPGTRCISIANYALIRIDESDKVLVKNHGAIWYEVDKLPNFIPLASNCYLKSLPFRSFKNYMKLFFRRPLILEILEKNYYP